ncbi:hypothetical protein [Methanobrevibacter boviskoreani]|nr:hypothetical protein [Methanobrevibacter boviskoreani]MDD6256583.1 hypothetical protein [Methanobrevibacter boviskoreani]
MEQKSGSITTVISKPLVEILNLQKGEKIEWILEVNEGDLNARG